MSKAVSQKGLDSAMKKDKQNNTRFSPIAIIGVSALFPSSRNAQKFWDNIIHKRDLIKDVPDSHWLIQDYFDPDHKKMDKTYCKRGAFLDALDFDPLEFGIPPNVVPALDPSQLLSLIVAKEAFDNATQGKYVNADLSKVSVILGTCSLQALQNVAARMQYPVWNKVLKEYGLPESESQKISDRILQHYIPWQENTFPGLLSNVVAGRIANRFNLGGTNCVVDAACAGSLAALSMGISELQLQKADMVLTGGFDALNDIVSFLCFSKTFALSFSNDCRPFSDEADGTVLGEGIGMFVLKRLDKAEEDGDTIYAVIRGIGTSSDGRSKSIYAPVAEGQKKAILRAYEQAGFSPSTVDLIEAHGTGTKAGDLAELTGLKLAFAKAGDTRIQKCAIGSVKSQIGHTKAAAGAAGLFKAMMALHHKILPPTIKVSKPNPDFEIEKSPFYINTEARPWVHSATHPRRAGVSSFGFGGSNFHILLEEYTGNKGKRPSRLRTFPTELIILTASSPEKLLQRCQTLLSSLTANSSLVAVAKETQLNWEKTFPTRLAIVATDIESLKRKLSQVISLIKSDPNQVIAFEQGIFYGNNIKLGITAFVLSGKDKAYPWMGEDLAMSFENIIKQWDSNSSQVGNTDFFHSVYRNLLKSLNIKAEIELEFDKTNDKDAFLADINKNFQKGVNVFIESGPDNFLTKFINSHMDKGSVYTVNLDRKGQHGITVLWNALGQLISIGFNPDLSVLWDDYFQIELSKTAANHTHLIKIDGAMQKVPEKAPEKNFAIKESTMNTNLDPYYLQMQQELQRQQQELQKQVIESHNNFQRIMAESHAVFLQTISNLTHSLQANNLNQTQMPQTHFQAPPVAQGMTNTISTRPAPIAQYATQTSSTPMQTAAPTIQHIAPAPAAPMPTITPTMQHVAPAPAAPMPTITPTMQHAAPAPVAPMSTAAPTMQHIASTPASLPASAPMQQTNSFPPPNSEMDLQKLLLEVVVDKTGYPANMLNMDMAIESDLGIDSIKRVEILSALSERLPNLPELNTTELSQLQTLSDILNYMKAKILVKIPV